MKKNWRAGIGFLIVLAGISGRAQINWHLPAAEVRFEVQIESRPSIPAAGIVAILPDAGILPKGKLKADVVDDSGRALKANLLWHNPNEGLALVFEDSPAAQALIYVAPAADYPKAAAPLRPSLLLFVRNGGKPSLEQARALAAKMPAGPDVYFTTVDRIFHSLSPVGRDEETSSYYTGWIQAATAGKTYFYTVSKDGSEFFIDGQPVYSWPGLHGRAEGERAEKGAWIDLSAGIHRIEYYHFAQSFRGRESQLGWQQAGESRPKNPKNPDFPNLEVTGPMEASDFVRSGAAILTAAASKQGPLAVIRKNWEALIQPGQTPVCLFRFTAFGSENPPAGTVYEWDFGGERKLKGPEAAWLYGGMDDQRVTLTVSSGQGKSIASKLFFPKSLDPAREPPRLSINRAQDRRTAQEIFLAMCRATPAGKRPGELWNAALWEGLAAVVDQQCEFALLDDLFQRSRPDILKLEAATRWVLEDAYYEALCRAGSKETAAWLNRFENEEKDAARRGQWMARLVEFHIFEDDNMVQARAAANEFAGAAAGLRQTGLAMIRMGDVELFSGHQDLAQRFYAQAQEAAQRQATSVVAAAAAIPRGRQRPRKTNSKPDRKATPPGGDAAAPGAPQSIEAWKAQAVHASAYYSTIRSLLDQQFYTEARKTLDQWELELPLDKLAGDFPLAAAEYYVALQQFKRAYKILATYRQSVDLSNNLPQTMKMELYCLTRLDRDQEAQELAGLIIKRLPNHPLAEEVKGLLAAAAAGGKLTVDLEAWSRDWTSSEKVDAAGLAELFGAKKARGTKTPPAAK